MKVRKKCRTCPVAEKVGGCLFGCNKKERVARELDLLVKEADSHIDPVLEQLGQCPEAFTVGKAVERMFQLLRSASVQDSDRMLPPAQSIISPFV